MESLWGVRPEVEGRVWILQVVDWVSLLGVDEVWELDWVLDEENWGVVADHIVVTLLGVMLDGKTTWVTVAIVSTTLSSHSGETEENWGLLANLVQELCLAETELRIC